MTWQDMQTLDIVIRLLAGLLVGFCVGLTGVGGGVLGMPVLTLGLGMPNTLAVGSLNAYGFISKSFAVYEHGRLKNIVGSVATYVLIGAIPTTISAAFLLGKKFKSLESSGDPADLAIKARLDSLVGLAIGAAMLIAVVLLTIDFLRAIRAGKKASETPADELPPEPTDAVDVTSPFDPPVPDMTGKKKIQGIAVGAVFGAVIGATSVGGGVLLIPLLILFFRMSASQTVGTSVLIAAVANLLGALSLGFSGAVDWVTVILLAIGSWLGIRIGSRLTKRVSDNWLKGAMIAIIGISTLMMFYKLHHKRGQGPPVAEATSDQSATSSDTFPLNAEPDAQ